MSAEPWTPPKRGATPGHWRSRNLSSLCGLCLSEENEAQRAKCHSVLAAFQLGHRVFWQRILVLLAEDFGLIHNSSNSGTIQVS